MLSSLCLNLSFQPRFCSPVSECLTGFFWHCLTPWTLNRQWQEPQKYKPRQSSRPLFLQYYMHYWNIYWTVLWGIYKTWMWEKKHSHLLRDTWATQTCRWPWTASDFYLSLGTRQKNHSSIKCVTSHWEAVETEFSWTILTHWGQHLSTRSIEARYAHSVQKWMQVLLEERAAVLHWELQGQNPWSGDKHESKYKTSHINLLSKCLSSRRR